MQIEICNQCKLRKSSDFPWVKWLLNNFKFESDLQNLWYYFLYISVVSGSISSVTDLQPFGESQIQISPDRVYRQKFKYFQTANQVSVPNSSTKRDSADHNFLIMPKKCGAKKGMGQFLFIGKLRLGRAILQCAPRLEQFHEIWQQAVQDKRNLCTLWPKQKLISVLQ